MNKLLVTAATAAFMIAPQAGIAGNMTFQFQNPSFGGSGLSTSHYLSLLEKQKPDFVTDGPLSTREAFEQQLERRLLSSLASTITQSIYGDGATESGVFEIGDLSVTYETIGDQVHIVIDDGLGTTEITVPASF